MERDDVAGQAMGPTPNEASAEGATPFRRHPVRWTVAAGGLAAMLAFGGYGVTQAAATSATGSGVSAFGGGGTGGPPGVLSASRGTPGAQTSAGSLAASVSTASSAGSESRTSANRSRNTTAGIITAFSGDSITLRTRERSTLVVIVTSATVLQEGTTKVASSALKKGDLAMVVGSTSSDGTVTASTITFGPTPNGAPGTGSSAPTA